jgi:putative FmdB family regulatory protein
MPTYDYQCTHCSKKLEIQHKISEAPRIQCPSCGENKLQRGPGGGVGLQFAGTGWYKTDYAESSAASAPKECCPCGKNKNSCSSTP